MAESPPPARRGAVSDTGDSVASPPQMMTPVASSPASPTSSTARRASSPLGLLSPQLATTAELRGQLARSLQRASSATDLSTLLGSRPVRDPVNMSADPPLDFSDSAGGDASALDAKLQAAIQLIREKETDAQLAAEIGQGLLERVHAAENEVEELKAELETVQDAKVQQDQRLAAMAAQLMQYEALGASSGTRDADSLAVRLEEAEDERTALGEQNARLRKQIETLECKCVSLAEERDAAQAEVRDITAKQHELEPLRAKLASTTAELDNAKAEAANALESEQLLEQELVMVRQEAKDAAARLVSERSLHRVAQNELQLAHGDVASLSTQLTDSQAVQETLRARVQQLESHVAGLGKLSDDQSAALMTQDELRAQNAQLKQQWSEDRVLLDQARETIAQLRAAADDAVAATASSGASRVAPAASKDSLLDELESVYMQRMNDAGGGASRKSPSEEYFILMCIALKISLSVEHSISSRALSQGTRISPAELHRRAVAANVPFHEWYPWLRAQLTRAYFAQICAADAKSRRLASSAASPASTAQH